jgi:endonuclease YncB( thermonuclease family)
LILTFSAIVLIFGRHHGGFWRAPTQGDPFPPTVSGRAEPIDGDSLWVGASEVRLKGIDAPEWKQACSRGGVAWKCGVEARDELARAIGGEDVVCTISERDVYGRMLGRCRAGDRDLNAGMVASGMAVAYGAYINQQASARARKAGLWSGQFEAPRDWRAGNAADERR